MPSQRQRLISTWAVVATVALATVGAALAQSPAPAAKAQAKGKANDKTAKGGLRAPGGAPPKKLQKNAADPFAAPANVAPTWPYHYKFKIASSDNTPLAAQYYPSQRNTAAVIMLVHEKGRLGKDFEDGIEDLKDKGLAEYLQGQGYAVLLLDLRGHGSNPRKELAPKEAPLLIRDLQAAYQFLVDRHNREELNLAKLGVVALGEGANVVAAWAATPGGAVSSEGRISDLGALVLVSPVADGFGYRLGPALATVAPRIPVLLMAGEKDNLSLTSVKEAQPTVVRQRQSKVELFPTSLHAYKLLRFQPKVPDAIMAFFDTTIKKVRSEDWEPRYNLTPVAYADIEIVRKKAAAAPVPAPAPAPAAAKAVATGTPAKKAADKPAAGDEAAKKTDDDSKKGTASPKNPDPPKAPAKSEDDPPKGADKKASR
jgi:Serine aminopeptidase, S33